MDLIDDPDNNPMLTIRSRSASRGSYNGSLGSGGGGNPSAQLPMSPDSRQVCRSRSTLRVPPPHAFLAPHSSPSRHTPFPAHNDPMDHIPLVPILAATRSWPTPTTDARDTLRRRHRYAASSDAAAPARQQRYAVGVAAESRRQGRWRPSPTTSAPPQSRRRRRLTAMPANDEASAHCQRQSGCHERCPADADDRRSRGQWSVGRGCRPDRYGDAGSCRSRWWHRLYNGAARHAADSAATDEPSTPNGVSPTAVMPNGAPFDPAAPGGASGHLPQSRAGRKKVDCACQNSRNSKVGCDEYLGVSCQCTRFFRLGKFSVRTGRGANGNRKKGRKGGGGRRTANGPSQQSRRKRPLSSRQPCPTRSRGPSRTPSSSPLAMADAASSSLSPGGGARGSNQRAVVLKGDVARTPPRISIDTWIVAAGKSHARGVLCARHLEDTTRGDCLDYGGGKSGSGKRYQRGCRGILVQVQTTSAPPRRMSASPGRNNE